MFRREVLETLRTDSALSEPVRREALALAENMREDPQRVNQASSSVVRSPGAEPAAYARASRLAEVACRLSPRNGVFSPPWASPSIAWADTARPWSR